MVLVKWRLGLHDLAFGWLKAVFGAGATAAALALGAFKGRWPRTRFILVGAVAISLAVLPANLAGFGALLPLWLLAGVGTNWVNLPMLALLAERTPAKLQGRVYGAHLAGSHLCWLGAYPLVRWLGSRAPQSVVPDRARGGTGVARARRSDVLGPRARREVSVRP